ncbi:MAG: NTPase [Nitrospinota bacterium]
MNILLTGMPGCGKSTLVQALIQALKAKKIAGIITPEIRDKTRRGFKIIDLASGREEILASVDIRSGPRVGKYGVNVAGVDHIVDLFRQSSEIADYIFLDEIGKMELFSRKFKETSDEVLNSNKLVVAVVHRNLASRYKNRGELIWVEREKIDEITKHVLNVLAASSSE